MTLKSGARLVDPFKRAIDNKDVTFIRILESRDDVDLVFTDVQMPGTMDGVKLSHYIRDRWPPVKLIVASGVAILEESSLPLGSSFFSKPYDDQAIADAMGACFRDIPARCSDEAAI